MIGYIIAYSYIATLLIVTLTGIIRYRKVREGYVRAMIHLLWLSALIEVVSKFILVPAYGRSLWLFNASIPVFFVLISIIYYQFFKEQTRIRQMIVIACIIFFLFYAANVIWMQDFYGQIYNYSIAAMSLFVVVCAFLYFRHKMRQVPPESLRRDSMFWISAGLLIFYGAEAFAMGSINYLNEVDRNLSSVTLGIVQMINIPMNAMFLIALLCQRSQTTFSSR